MVTWGVTDAGVEATATGRGVTVEATAWNGDPGSLPSLQYSTTANRRSDSYVRLSPPTGDAITGRASELRLPATGGRLTRTDTGETQLLSDGLSVPRGEYELTCLPNASADTIAKRGADRQLVVDFRGSATIERLDGTLRVAFEDRSSVSIGVEIEDEPETEPITVPPTTAGLATAITHLSAAHRSMGPARSHPAFRRHPPGIEIGSKVDVPDTVANQTPHPGIELVVPDSFPELFVTAPLAYYLGADVTVADVDAPRIEIPDLDVTRQFSPLPECQSECATLLREVFFLDCLVRRTDGDRDTSQFEPLETAGLDAERLRTLSPAERLARYLDVAGEQLRSSLPDWHLSTYATPKPDHATVLPHLLNDLSLIYLPSATEVEESELLEVTLSDSFRATSCAVDYDTASNVVKPTAGTAGRVQAWLAPGTPINAFKTTPSAYENRKRYPDRTDTPFSVSVVLNDGEMQAEHESVAEIYRQRSADLPLDVTLYEDLTRAQLREVIESGTDFLHYIGHCEPDGLKCADGNLSIDSVDTSRTRTFFLNACGSYEAGLELVERGSVAGAVTLTAVLNEHAAKVGTAFARLIMHGFSIGRSMQLARRRILMGKDYAVVGDGTDALVPSPGDPAVIWLEENDQSYTVSYEAMAANTTGYQYHPPFGERPYLYGRKSEHTISAEEVVDLLEETSLPVIYNGEFHWSADLAATLQR